MFLLKETQMIFYRTKLIKKEILLIATHKTIKLMETVGNLHLCKLGLQIEAIVLLCLGGSSNSVTVYPANILCSSRTLAAVHEGTCLGAHLGRSAAQSDRYYTYRSIPQQTLSAEENYNVTRASDILGKITYVLCVLVPFVFTFLNLEPGRLF